MGCSRKAEWNPRKPRLPCRRGSRESPIAAMWIRSTQPQDKSSGRETRWSVCGAGPSRRSRSPSPVHATVRSSTSSSMPVTTLPSISRSCNSPPPMPPNRSSRRWYRPSADVTVGQIVPVVVEGHPAVGTGRIVAIDEQRSADDRFGLPPVLRQDPRFRLVIVSELAGLGPLSPGQSARLELSEGLSWSAASQWRSG